MGEASRSKKTIIESSTHCLYCDNPATTVEHMPPRSMFKSKNRPSGMEFGCCENCNRATRHVDLLAALVCRLQAYNDDPELESEIFGLHRMLMSRFPKIGISLFENTTTRNIWVNSRAGILQRKVELNVKSDLFKRTLFAFSAKLSMALFKIHVGKELESSGAIETSYYLNAGLSKEAEDTFLRMLPLYGTLMQGTKTSSGEFDYRYNTDKSQLLSFIARFHTGLTVFSIVSSDLEKYPLPFGFPNSSLIRPPDLLALAAAE